MSTSPPVNQILQVTGMVTSIGEVRYVNKTTIKQSFVLEIMHPYGIEVIKFYCKNELCNILPYLTGEPMVTVSFTIVGTVSKNRIYTNHFEILSITKN